MTSARSILSHAIATEVQRARALAPQEHVAEVDDRPACDQGQKASAEAQRMKLLPAEHPIHSYWLW